MNHIPASARYVDMDILMLNTRSTKLVTCSVPIRSPVPG